MLEAVTDVEHPTALEGEIALARLLVTEATNRGDSREAANILKIIGRLTAASEVAKFRRGDLLNRTAVLGIAARIVEVLSAEVAGRFQGWEDVLDGVKLKVLDAVSEAQNPDPNELGKMMLPEET